MSGRTSRREFLKRAGRAGAGLWAAGGTGCALLRGRPRRISPGEKLNIACIGAGGKGATNVNGVKGENIIALCDVDENNAGKTFERFSHVRRYQDYRVMLEREAKHIDAVVVSTPDHIHAPAAVLAMQLGKHVYCEKPLAHSVWEARRMAETAARCGVATQMGNQGHSFDGHRRAVELLHAGVLGPVREAHVWSDRPIWPQGIERPTEPMEVPATLRWDLWLGPAPWRPYHKCYAPFTWRGWYDFGTGALGDMGCHNMDVVFWGLKLGAPRSVEAEVSGRHKETYPKRAVVTWQFPAREGLPPVALKWYDGGEMPPEDLAMGHKLPTNGALIVGDKGTLFAPDSHADGFQLWPEKDWRDFEGPPPTIPRVPTEDQGQKVYDEWIAACKGGPPALSNFSYSGPMTEAVVLGNVAIRLGRRIEWDAKRMEVKNCPEAEPLIRPDIPRGWGI